MNKKALALSLIGLISFSSSQACDLPKKSTIKVMKVIENGALLALAAIGAASTGALLVEGACELTNAGIRVGKGLGNFALESARDPQILKNAASKLAQDVVQNAPRIANNVLIGASVGVFGYTLLQLYKLSNPL